MSNFHYSLEERCTSHNNIPERYNLERMLGVHVFAAGEECLRRSHSSGDEYRLTILKCSRLAVLLEKA